MDSLANLIETFATNELVKLPLGLPVLPARLLQMFLLNLPTNELVKLAIPMAVGALIIIGLGFLLGFQRVVDWCKSHILYIVAGLVCVYLAQELVTTVVSNLNGF